MLQVANRLFVVNQLRDGRVCTANRAVVRLGREFDLAEFHGKRIVREQVTREQVAHAEDVLDRFHRLQTSDDTAHRADDAGLLAGRHGVFRRGFLEHAAVARSLARNVCHELALKADDARMGEGLLRHHARIVDEELRREIVCPVNHEIVILDEVKDVPARDERVVRNHLHVGIHRFHRLFCGLHLQLAHVLGGVDNLALQIREIHDVGIGNTDSADTCRREVHGGRGAQASCTDNQHLRVQQLLLALRTHLFQDDVAGIAF